VDAAPGLISETARADGVSDIIIAVAAATLNDRMISRLKPGSLVRS
jgi:hypothetical protein